MKICPTLSKNALRMEFSGVWDRGDADKILDQNFQIKRFELCTHKKKLIKRYSFMSNFTPKDVLQGWVKEKHSTGQVLPKNKWNAKDIEQQRKAAVVSFIKHNHNLALTLKDIGYRVSLSTL